MWIYRVVKKLSVSQETYDKAVSYYQNENKRLREALEYYAHKPLYQTSSSYDVWKYDILKDAGHIARKALAGD